MNTGNTVSIYGYGRFGKFWAEHLKETFHIKVFSRRGLQNQDLSPGLGVCNEKEIYNCDTIVYCVAISALQDVLKEGKPHCKPGTIFFDTCSVKMLPSKWMKEYLPPESKIIAAQCSAPTLISRQNANSLW